MKRKLFAGIVIIAALLSGCGSSAQQIPESSETQEMAKAEEVMEVSDTSKEDSTDDETAPWYDENKTYDYGFEKKGYVSPVLGIYLTDGLEMAKDAAGIGMQSIILTADPDFNNADYLMMMGVFPSGSIDTYWDAKPNATIEESDKKINTSIGDFTVVLSKEDYYAYRTAYLVKDSDVIIIDQKGTMVNDEFVSTSTNYKYSYEDLISSLFDPNVKCTFEKGEAVTEIAKESTETDKDSSSNESASTSEPKEQKTEIVSQADSSVMVYDVLVTWYHPWGGLESSYHAKLTLRGGKPVPGATATLEGMTVGSSFAEADASGNRITQEFYSTPNSTYTITGSPDHLMIWCEPTDDGFNSLIYWNKDGSVVDVYGKDNPCITRIQ